MPQTINISSLRALKKKKSSLKFFYAEIFKLQQNLLSFAFSNRPFYTLIQYFRGQWNKCAGGPKSLTKTIGGMGPKTPKNACHIKKRQNSSGLQENQWQYKYSAFWFWPPRDFYLPLPLCLQWQSENHGHLKSILELLLSNQKWHYLVALWLERITYCLWLVKEQKNIPE